MKKILLVISLLICLTACSKDAEDIKNITGDSVGQLSPSPSEKSAEELFADHNYNHFSSEEYTENLLDLEDRQEISELKKNYNSDCAYVKSNSRNLIRFNECVFSEIPDVDSVYAIKILDENLSKEAAIELIVYWLKKLNLYEKSNIETEIRDLSAYNSEKEEHYLAVETPSDNGGFFCLNNDYCNITIMGGGIESLCTGLLSRIYEQKNGIKPNPASETDSLLQGNVIREGSFDELKDEEYELLDGKMSISDAAEFVKSFFNYSDEKESIDIYRVEIREMDDKYLYKFYVRRRYNQIVFNVYEMGYNTTYLKEYMITGDVIESCVADSSGICTISGATGDTDVLYHCPPQKKMLGIKDAVDRVYKVMSEEYDCDIMSAGLVYCLCMPMEIKPVDNEKLAIPAWEFVGHSKTNGKSIKIYVDALTGEVGFYEYW